MKKVVAILGSKRKLNTYDLLIRIKKLLEKNEIELEIIYLYKHDIKDCNGCEICIQRGNCVINDDVPQIMDKLSKADGIILASPVYLQQLSGRMKNFIDRTCSWYHRPVLTGKSVLCVGTTKGSGLKATLSYLESVGLQWGAMPAGSVGRSIYNFERPVSDKEIRKFMKLLNEPQAFSPTIRQLISFEVQKSLAIYLKGLDEEYWTKMNWLEKPYFFSCKVSYLKKLISGIVGYFMRKMMTKGVN